MKREIPSTSYLKAKAKNTENDPVIKMIGMEILCGTGRILRRININMKKTNKFEGSAMMILTKDC